MLRFKEIAARLNGFSTPVFGLSWLPPAADREVAHRVLSRLESKRVLYQEELHREVSEHVVKSVLDMRAYFDQVIGDGGIADELSDPLRKMRRACLTFLDESPDQDVIKRLIASRYRKGRWVDTGDPESLLRLRTVFLHQISVIAIRYGLDVEEPLAGQLPKVLTDD